MKARRQDDLQKAVTHFIPEFIKESDRGCVLVVAAMAEGHLEEMLKAKLVAISNTRDQIFDLSFAAKIDFAYRLGLISATFCENLHTLRDIRNEFAHNILDCNFQKEDVKERLSKLKKSAAYFEDIYDIFVKIAKHNPAVASMLSGSKVKNEFMVFTGILLYAFAMAKNSIGGQIEPAEVEAAFKIVETEQTGSSSPLEGG